MAKGFSKLKPKTGDRDNVRLEDLVEMFKLPDNEAVELRFIDKPIISVKVHWLKIYGGKDKREISIPRYCLKHNAEDEESPKDVECPYCELPHGKEEAASVNFFYLANAIVRSIQDDEPRKKGEMTKSEKKTGFKDRGSKTWTPVRVIRIPSTVATRMQELSEKNLVKSKKSGKKEAYDVSDDKFGIDISIKYKPKAAGSEKYSADKMDERSPLTEDEQAYLAFNLTDALLDAAGRMTEKQAIEDLKRMELRGSESTDDDDDDDDGRSFGKKKKGAKGKSKGKSAFDEDDEDDDEDDEDDEPKGKSKKSKKSSSKKKARDEDDEDDDDDDDDEDDYEPKGKSKKSSKKSSSKKKKSRDDDDDDDDDDEPKSKKSSKKKAPAKKSKKSRDDDDDDDDDEDDEPKSKKSKKSSKSDKSGKKKKKKSFDEEDDIPF